MSGPVGDPRFDLNGIRQISDMVFEIYRGGERAKEWLEETLLSYSLVRDWVEYNPTSIFALRVRYSGTGPLPTSPSRGTDRYESWKVTFYDAGEAALFKLTFL